MSNGTALMVQPGGGALYADNPAERRQMFLDQIQRDINENQLAFLFAVCDRYGFDPLMKHIVLIQRGIYVTRDGMRQYADRTGELDGISEVERGLEPDGGWRVTVAVYRKGRARPFVATAFQREHENPKSAPWQRSPYRMTFKCAELSALKMAFPVALGGAEEVGYDEVSERTNIGRATFVNARPEAVAAAPVVMLTDTEVARAIHNLGALDADGVAFTAIRAEADTLRDRASDAQWAAIRAALKTIGDRRKAQAAAQPTPTPAPQPDPTAYRQHVRDDAQPILGDTPEARLAMLARIRAASAAAGVSEETVNRHVGRAYAVQGIEALTAGQAEELIGQLEAQSGFQPASTPAKPYPDDDDDVPF